VDAANNNVVANQRQRPRAIRKQGDRLRNDFRNGFGGKSISCARSDNEIRQDVFADGLGGRAGSHCGEGNNENFASKLKREAIKSEIPPNGREVGKWTRHLKEAISLWVIDAKS
jgi:hypothetical protein